MIRSHDPGSQDGAVHVWEAESGHKLCVLDGGHPGPTRCVQFNPKYMSMVTTCNNLVSGWADVSHDHHYVIINDVIY